MLRKFSLIAFVTLVLSSLTCFAAWGAGNAFIAIDSVPEIDDGDTVSGHVWFDGDGNYSDYKISMAVEVARGGEIWAPKPTADEPTVRINADGTFSCRFVSGGSDRIAERLYVYLVPASFTPNHDVATTEQAALDVVIIDRYEGRVDIRPKYPAPLKHPARTKKLSLNYSPYTEGLSPENGSPISADHVRRQLALLHPYTDTIRIFGVTGELNKIYKIAKEEFHFRVIGGCWIDRNSTAQEIGNELDTLVHLVDSGYIDIALVGSETLYRKDLPVEDLIQHIEYVRGKIAKKVPVGTSDGPDAFIDNPSLVKASDVVCCTVYPFFSQISAGVAASNMAATYDRVVNAVNDPKINVLISETGWPDAGSPEGAAVPSVENARKYFEDVYRLSREKDMEVVWFEGFSEPWKAADRDVEMHFGLFTSDEKLKEGFRPLLQTILDVPANDFNPSTSSSGGGCTAASGIPGFAGLCAVILAGFFWNRR